MSVKIFCDKEGCGGIVDESEGGGTVAIVMKTSTLNPNTNELVPGMDQKEYHLCGTHAKEVESYLKTKKVEEENSEESSNGEEETPEDSEEEETEIEEEENEDDEE